MSSLTHAHPSDTRLRAFHDGRTDRAESPEIEEHVNDCAKCRQFLDGLPPDEFATALRVAGRPAPGSPGKKAASGQPAVLAGHPRYKVVREVGRGGMGIVYEAFHVGLLEKRVAIKIIHPDRAADPDAVGRFRQEIKAFGHLDSPHTNIVAVHDAELYEGSLFCVMDFVEGLSLDHMLRQRGNLPPAVACEYVRQAALGLQKAHECGLVHRDIKPHNLIITADGTVKIVDFGLAKVTSRKEDLPGITMAGALMGTADYMAPEQITDAQGADIRADIYSLGFTLYCLLAGSPPYSAVTGRNKFMAHLNPSCHPKPLAELGIAIPTGLAAIIDRMTKKDPDERFQTPKDVADALQPFASADPSSRFQTPKQAADDLQTLPPATAAACTPPPSPWTPGKVAVAASLVLVCVALVAFIAPRMGNWGDHNRAAVPAAGLLAENDSASANTQQAKGKSELLTTAAWLAFKEGEGIVTKEKEPAKRADAIPHFEEAIRQAQLCIDEFEERADSMQKDLTQSKITIPRGRVDDAAKKAVHQNWAVNDVGTCLLVKGRSSEYLLQFECLLGDQNKANGATETLAITGDKAKQLYAAARAAYKAAADLTHARCWDPDGFFTCPSETAGDGLKRLEKKYTKP